MNRRTTTVILGSEILLVLMISSSLLIKSVLARAIDKNTFPGRIDPVSKNSQGSGKDLSKADLAQFKSLPRFQASDAETCRLLIEKTVAHLGWSASDIFVTDNGGINFTCGIYDQYVGSEEYPFRIQIYSASIPGNNWPLDAIDKCNVLGADCTWVDVHGLPGRQGSKYIPLALEFYDSSCNLIFYITTPPFKNHSVNYEPIADALYDSAVEVGCGQAVGDTQPNPNNPGDQSGGDVPTIPGDPTVSDNPQSLGPLATTPIVPLAGALVGTVIGWLVSVAATSGNILKTVITAPPSPSQPPSTTAGPDIGNVNTTDQIWSERPWDEAGPGYVSREEYERTKGFLERGYKWTKDGWQSTDEIRQSDQWQHNNREAVAHEEDVYRLKIEQDRLNARHQQTVEAEKLESTPQQNQDESHLTFESGAEGGLSGAKNSHELTRGVGGKVTLYKDVYYDAKDVLGDIKIDGVDIGNWKADGQFGKTQAGIGFGYDQASNSYSAGGSFEKSTYQLTGEGVVGNNYAGITGDAQVDGPKVEGFIGLRDGSVGGSIGGSIVSGEAGIGVNVANVNVGVRGGLSFGLELGFKVSTTGAEIKLGPFKLGLSVGGAKTGS